MLAFSSLSPSVTESGKGDEESHGDITFTDVMCPQTQRSAVECRSAGLPPYEQWSEGMWRSAESSGLGQFNAAPTNEVKRSGYTATVAVTSTVKAQHASHTKGKAVATGPVGRRRTDGAPHMSSQRQH